MRHVIACDIEHREIFFDEEDYRGFRRRLETAIALRGESRRAQWVAPAKSWEAFEVVIVRMQLALVLDRERGEVRIRRQPPGDFGDGKERAQD